MAGTLGHHFAVAGEPGRAVHYLEQAGDHAASAFANEEAVSSYRYALDMLSKDGSDRTGIGDNTTIKAETELRLKIAFVLIHIGRFVEAREVLQEGLRAVGTGDEILAARLYNRLARVEFDGLSDYDAALTSVRSGIGAARYASPRPGARAPRPLARYPDGHGVYPLLARRTRPDAGPLGRGSACARNRGGTAARSRLAITRSGSAWQLAERRHRVNEQVLAEARQALSAAEESGEYMQHSAAVIGFRLLLAVLRRPRWRRRVAHRCASDGRA